MTVIASFIYRGGERAEELALSDKPFQEVDGEFAWIGVAEPTLEEMTNLEAMFGLHPLAVEDALNGKQVPKVEVYGSAVRHHQDGPPRGRQDRRWRNLHLRRPTLHRLRTPRFGKVSQGTARAA